MRLPTAEAYPRLRSQSILIPEQLYRRYFRPRDRKFTYPGLGPGTRPANARWVNLVRSLSKFQNGGASGRQAGQTTAYECAEY
jgi:hypothetical protein